MTILFKIALIAGALLTMVFILRKIRRAEIKIADSTFWFLFAASLVLLALFPQIAFFFSKVLAIESPANFVFLYVIAALVIREFNSTAELSQLRNKLTSLVQAEALHNASEDGEPKQVLANQESSTFPLTQETTQDEGRS